MESCAMAEESCESSDSFSRCSRSFSAFKVVSCSLSEVSEVFMMLSLEILLRLPAGPVGGLNEFAE